MAGPCSQNAFKRFYANVL